MGGWADIAACTAVVHIMDDVDADISASQFTGIWALFDAFAAVAGISVVASIAAGTAVGAVGQSMDAFSPANDIALGDCVGFGIGFTCGIAVIDANAVLAYFCGLTRLAAFAAVLGIIEDIGTNAIAAAQGIGWTAAIAAAGFFEVAADIGSACFFRCFAEVFTKDCRFAAVGQIAVAVIKSVGADAFAVFAQLVARACVLGFAAAAMFAVKLGIDALPIAQFVVFATTGYTNTVLA